MDDDKIVAWATAEKDVWWDGRFWKIGEIDFEKRTVLLVRPIFERGRDVPFDQLDLSHG